MKSIINKLKENGFSDTKISNRLTKKFYGWTFIEYLKNHYHNVKFERSKIKNIKLKGLNLDIKTDATWEKAIASKLLPQDQIGLYGCKDYSRIDELEKYSDIIRFTYYKHASTEFAIVSPER